MKYFIIFAFSVIMFSSTGNKEKKNYQTVTEPSIQSQVNTTSKSQQDTLPDTTRNTSATQNPTSSNQNNDQVYGIERIGPFKMHTYHPGNTSKYHLYKGDPKVEILDKKGKVVKVIDIIKTQQLLPDYVSLIPHPNLRNTFLVGLIDSQDVYKYVNTDYFGKVKPMPSLLYKITYEVHKGVLWIQNVAYGIDTDVYGGQTEIIGIDSTGKEIGRMQVKGYMSSFSVTENNIYVALGTGGLATERVEYFNPMRFYAIDFLNKEIIYQYSNENDCISGGTVNNKIVMELNRERNCGNIEGLYKITIFEPQNNFKFVLNESMIRDYEGLYPLYFKDHFEWHRPNSKNIILNYEKDFISSPLMD